MDKSEKLAIWVSALLLVSFVGALVYAFWGLNIRFPGCVTDKEPFTKGRVIQKAVGEYEVHYVAKMWAFEPAVLEVPVGSKVDIYLSSLDVNHGFQIKFTNTNIMAVPGAVNYAQITFDTPGEYPVVCHEYCGTGHQNMMGLIRVSARDESLTAAVPQSDLGVESPPKSASTLSEASMAVLSASGCVACHSLDGTRMVGPSFKGIFGRKTVLEDGSEITADEAYLTESIRAPMTKIVKGYPKVMVAMPLSDEQIKQIVEVLKQIQ